MQHKRNSYTIDSKSIQKWHKQGCHSDNKTVQILTRTIVELKAVLRETKRKRVANREYFSVSSSIFGRQQQILHRLDDGLRLVKQRHLKLRVDSTRRPSNGSTRQRLHVPSCSHHLKPNHKRFSENKVEKQN